MQFWKNLSWLWRIVIIVGVLVLSMWILDATTGYVSNFRSWMFDQKQAKIEEANKKLEDENVLLRKERDDWKTKALALDVQIAAIEASQGKKGTEITNEQDRIKKVLEEFKKEEEQTAEPTDAYTRCVRLKDKLLVLHIPSAKEINCEEYK